MFRLAAHLLALLAVAGCEKPAPAPAAAATAPNNAPVPAPTTYGILSGKVTLTGWTQPPPAAQMVTCGDHKIPVVNQSVVLKNNGLDNVVIYLKNAPPTTATGTLAPALLDQVGCMYVPHVLAMRTGQALTVINNEGLLHNVHMLSQNNPTVNFGMTHGSSHNVVFNKPEILPVKCDVHPWMMAYIAVFDHPWFAVTTNGGKFAISHVPAGPQTFVAWHERFGEIEQTVTITTDQAREITFNFKPPDAAQ